MSFIQPFALFGLILALSPIIIHLLNLMRHRTQPWAATLFLLQARKNSSKISKVKRWLTLFLRVLALGSLFLFIARPTIGGDSLLSFSSPAPEVIVLILDRSSSMEERSETSVKTKRELALNIFEQFIEPWPDSRIVLVESVFEEPFFISDFGSFKESNFDEIIGPTSTSSSLPQTILKSLRWMDKIQVGTAHIIVCSDMQKSNWNTDKSINQFTKIDQILSEKKDFWTLKIAPLEIKNSYNYSISIEKMIRKADSIVPSILIKQDQNNGLSEEIDVKISINGNSQSNNVLISKQKLKWQTNLSLKKQPKEGWGSVSLDDDFCNTDNNHFFSYRSNLTTPSAILSSNSGIQLILSSAAQNEDGEMAKSQSLEDFKMDELRGKKMIIYQGHLNSKSKLGAHLENFARDGGTLVLFPDQGEEKSQESLMNWGKSEKKEGGNYFQIKNWARSDSVLANFGDNTPLPLDFLIVRNRKIPQKGEILAYYEDGKAFLTRLTYGNGLIYAFSTLPVDSWSSLKDGYVLVPIIQRMIKNTPTSKIGSNDLVCGSEETKEILEYECLDQPGQKNPALHAGVYQVGNRIITVNRPEKEDDREKFNLTNLQAKLPNTHAIQKIDSYLIDSLKHSEIWTTFLCFCIALLLLEAFLGLPQQTRIKKNPNV